MVRVGIPFGRLTCPLNHLEPALPLKVLTRRQQLGHKKEKKEAEPRGNRGRGKSGGGRGGRGKGATAEEDNGVATGSKGDEGVSQPKRKAPADPKEEKGAKKPKKTNKK